MAQVTVKINGYGYTVACEDGQEAHLQQMARDVEGRIEGIKAAGGGSGEGKLLVMAALLLADELHDMAIEANSLRAGAPASPAAAARPAESRQSFDSRRLALLAQKAEDIAASIEQP